MAEASKTATLTVNGKSYELPLVPGSVDELAVDVSSLRDKTGAITLDDGYSNTGSCKSAITFIDGEKGILRYRGYPIEQLAEHSSFLEVSWLLIHGELPSRQQLTDFQHALTRHSLVHEDMRRFFDAFPPDAHPMAIISSVVCGLSTFYQDSHSATDAPTLNLTVNRLIAKLPTIAAFAYRKSRGYPLMYPDNALDYSSNFMRMMF